MSTLSKSKGSTAFGVAEDAQAPMRIIDGCRPCLVYKHTRMSPTAFGVTRMFPNSNDGFCRVPYIKKDFAPHVDYNINTCARP